MNLEKDRIKLNEYRDFFACGITPEDADMLGGVCLNTGVMLTDGAGDDKEQRRMGMDYLQLALDVYQFAAQSTSMNKYRQLFYEAFDRLMPLAEEDDNEELLLQLQMRLLKFAKLRDLCDVWYKGKPL